MKICQNCGAEMEQDALFCRECGTRFSENHLECGTVLTEHSVNQSGKPLSYLEEILDKHLQYYPNKEGNDVKTNIIFASESHVYELIIKSDSDNALKIEVSFKDSNNKERNAFERFKQTKYYSSFIQNLMQTDGYNGYIELSGKNDYAKTILSDLFTNVYQKKDDKLIGYRIWIGDKSIVSYDIKDGVHVKKEGCLAVVIAIIVTGAALTSLL